MINGGSKGIGFIVNYADKDEDEDDEAMEDNDEMEEEKEDTYILYRDEFI